MTEEIPSSGPKREILMRSLRAYSDSCEPPELTPGCPFVVELADGSSGCTEECVDLIAVMGAPDGEEYVVLGGGFSVRRRRRPRARRGLPAGARPFDAGAIYLTESEVLPMDAWSIVSLLYELRKSLGQPPPEPPGDAEERRNRVLRAIELLKDRGLDFDEDLRAGLGGPLALLIASLVVLAPRSQQLSDIGESDGLSSIVDRWRLVTDAGTGIDPTGAEVSDGDVSAFERGAFDRFVERVLTWVATASIDEMINWFPSSGQLAPSDPVAVKSVVDGDRWVVDRFLGTYLDSWETASLHAEWEWIHGHRPSPVAPGEMRTRPVDKERLANLIADRAIAESRVRPTPLPMAQYQAIAGELIEQGRRDAAAGIFEAAIAVDPSSAEAHNNLGFCLIEDSPRSALEALERASELGYEPPLVNLANRALCLHRLGHLAASMDVIEQGFEAASLALSVPAFLWTPNPANAPQLVQVDDISYYFATLGLVVAEAAMDDGLADVWKARLG